MEESKFTFIHVLFTIGTAVLSAVSYHLSRLGLDTVVDSKLVSHIVALSGAIFAFSVYYYLMQRFPAASVKRKIAYSLVFVGFGVLLVFFSTQFSVITLAGQDAVTTHMQAILQQSDLQGLKLLDRGVREGNLSIHLEDLAENFERYARDEAESGAFSGLEGSGSVVTSLKYVAEQFKSLSQRVQSTEKELSGLYEDLKLEISDARRLLLSDMPVKAMNLNFDKHVSEINDILTRLSHQSSLDYVTQINRNLQKISFIDKEGDSAEQKDAMRKLAENVEAAQEVLNKIASKEELAETRVQTFHSLSMSQAVMTYFTETAYGWAFSMAIDFSAFIFLLLLSIHQWTGDEQTQRVPAAPRYAAPVNGNGHAAQVAPEYLEQAESYPEMRV